MEKFKEGYAVGIYSTRSRSQPITDRAMEAEVRLLLSGDRARGFGWIAGSSVTWDCALWYAA